jgi:SAM-dependent methyltransferase
MVRQRPLDAAPVVYAVAEALPFASDAFAAGLAILTVHHWADRLTGLREMSRVVSDRVVVLTWDPESDGFWLVQDYFPEFIVADRKRLPALSEFKGFLEDMKVVPLPVPHDCTDGFLGAYWRRPAEYLREDVRAGISSFATCKDLGALKRLDEDLANGTWRQRYAHLLQLDELDIGYRLIVGRPHAARS